MAALSLRTLLLNGPAVNLRAKSQNWPSGSTSLFPNPILSKFHITPLSIDRCRIEAYSASYTETVSEVSKEDDEGIEEEEEGGAQEIPAKKVAPKRLKKDKGRIYVGNLPYTTTSKDLAELFSQAGSVISADVIYNRETEKSRGFGFVNMIDEEGAEAAIHMFDQTLIDGRKIRVNLTEVPRGGEREVLLTNTRPSNGYVDSAYKLYAGNLGWAVTSDALKEAFSHLNGLLGAKVIFDRETGRSRGYAFISFVSIEDANAALESMNGVDLEGRDLRIHYARDDRIVMNTQEIEQSEE